MMKRCITTTTKPTDVDPAAPSSHRISPPRPALLGFRTPEPHIRRKRRTQIEMVDRGHQRNRPFMEGPSKAFTQTWTAYDNPLFYDDHHRHCRCGRHEEQTRDALKAELEKERGLRKKAEAMSESAAKDVAEERKRREAAEIKAKELAEALKNMIADMGRPRSVANCLQPRSFEGDNNRQDKEQQKQEQKRKEVENPHIRRGIVGFVEFPKMLRNRRGGGGGAGKREGKGGGVDTAANLECQKAQFRVLLKSSNTRVSPLGNLSPSSASACQKRVVSSHQL